MADKFEKTIENVRESAEQIFEKSKDKASDVKVEAMKLFDNAKKESLDLKDKAASVGEDILKKVERYFADKKKDANNIKDDIVEFKDEKQKEVKKEIKGFKKNVEGLTEEKKFPTGKVVAGVAVAAAAAGAYYVYKKNQEKDASIKAEFSEKLKKWDDEHLNDDEKLSLSEVGSMRVKPNKVYKLNHNGKVSDKIVVNISSSDSNITFNPEEKAVAVNPIAEIKQRAEEIAKNAGQKAKDVSQIVAEKASEMKSEVSYKVVEAKEVISEKASTLKGKAEEVKDAASSKINSIKNNEKEDNLDQDNKETKDLENKVENFKNESEEIIENKMEKDPKDPIEEIEDNFHKSSETDGDIIKIKVNDNPKPSNEVKNEMDKEVSKEEIEKANDKTNVTETESVLMQKGEELLKKAKEFFGKSEEVIGNVKETLVEKVDSFKKEKNMESEELTLKTFNFAIHNGSDVDYYFTPVLIQRYNSTGRYTVPTPIKEEGTELEAKTIKPGETYSGKISLKMSESDDGIIVFEDLTLKNSILFLMEDELSDDYIKEETDDLELVNEILNDESTGLSAKKAENEKSESIL